MGKKSIKSQSGAILEEALILVCVILLCSSSFAALGQSLSDRMYAAGGSLSTAGHDDTLGTTFGPIEIP